MTEISRGLSYVVYRYDAGDALSFAVPFPYIERTHVRAFVAANGTDAKRQVSFGWDSPTSITIADQGASLQPPYLVTLQRVTPTAELLVQFKAGANLPARDLMKDLSQLLYALQEATELGTAAAGGIGGGGQSGGGYTDINEIVNQVVQSPAYQALQDKIPLLDQNAELIMGELLRSNDYFDSKRIHEDRLNKAETRLTLTESATEVAAEQVTELHANVDSRLGDLTTSTTAQYNELNQALANEESARSVAVQDLYSQVTTETDGKISSTTATINSQLATKATQSEAEAIASTAVQSFAGGQFAAFQQTYNTYVNANDSRWNATWSLKVNGGDPANPVVGGIALGADTNGSTFVVQADRFAFTTPGATTGAGARFPFVIGTVGGVDTVGVTGQLLVDGSVSANKITVNTLSAITANAGTINGGTFKTLSLDANGNPINALEFRAEMSNIGDWPLWVGSGEKTENNAVFYLKKDGSAMFKGKVTAPNIVGQFQASTVVAWSGNVSICTYAGGSYYPKSDYTDIAQFTLGTPLLVGESHTPFVAVTVGMNKLTYGVDALLEQLVGGIWVPVVSHVASSITVFAAGSEGTSITNINPTGTFRAQESSFSLIGVAQSSTGTTTFRVRVKGATTYVNGISVTGNAVSYNDGDRTVTSVSGSILGIR